MIGLWAKKRELVVIKKKKKKEVTFSSNQGKVEKKIKLRSLGYRDEMFPSLRRIIFCSFKDNYHGKG